MSSAGAVVALVLIEWAAGLAAMTAWIQSWDVVRRGFFRINCWIALALAVLGTAAAATADVPRAVVILASLLTGLQATAVATQYLGSDGWGVAVGGVASAAGAAALIAAGGSLQGWSIGAAAAALLIGAALTGGVSNGMLLGHWYLNQPGLKTWALGRVTTATLVALCLSALVGLLFYGELSGARTPGPASGLLLGGSFGLAFYITWMGLVIFTGAVTWGARRCVAIRSIQSATGLYYVAILTGGVGEFLVRYLMVNAR